MSAPTKKPRLAESPLDQPEQLSDTAIAIVETAAPPAPSLAHRLASLPKLALALAGAQAKCEAADKDSWNAFHKYHYASSEAVITAAKVALAGSGLAVLPCEQSVNGWERQGENRFELERKFLLLHSSGESLPILVRWPICPEKGRPLDKATAIAATLSLAYFLRDLLLMPRVDPSDELAGQHSPEPARAQAPRAGKPKAEAPTGQALLDRLAAKDAEIARAGFGAPGAMLEAIARTAKAKGLGDDITKIQAPYLWLTQFVKDYEEAGRKAMGQPKAAPASGAPKWPQIARNEPGPYITPEQAQTICKLLGETDTNPSAFADFFSIVDLDRLPLARYDQAIDLLTGKKAKLRNKGHAATAAQ